MDNFEKWCKERIKQLLHEQKEYENAVRQLKRKNRK
jgi:hypothetical protein